MIPVILAGGSGTRLWPLSRSAFPKQFLSLGYDQTMLQQTVARIDGLSDDAPMIITSESHRFLVAEQLRQIGRDGSILLEPVGRNTAPAIALAAFQALVDSRSVDSRLRGNDREGVDPRPTPTRGQVLHGNQRESEAPILLVLAADHVIKDTAAFQAAVNKLHPAVREGKFGTLGIVPTEPATGYGYIKAGAESSGLFVVEQFVEKPDVATARRYLDENAALSGESPARKWYWNSGMFMIRADRYLEELKRLSPEMYAACEAAMADTQSDMDFIRINAEAFEQCPDDSIDYAIMEPLTAKPFSTSEGEPQVVVEPLVEAGWSDVGSWSALWDIANKCDNGNAVLHAGKGEGDTILKDTRNSLISTSDRLISTLGVDDLVIVDTKDALLIADKSKVQNVKDVVSVLKEHGLPHHEFHRELYRPWGLCDSIDPTLNEPHQGYKVKRLTVRPGAKLSLQMHHHRAEHWIVVSGTAKVTNGENTIVLAENESTYIPIGQTHCLENPGTVDLEIIEVQSGSYLGEDDIVRFEDKYGRV